MENSEPKPSDKVSIVKVFKYRGVEVFIKKCYNVYEFILAINDKIYLRYYEAVKAKKKSEDKELEDQIIANLCTIAVNTIDREKVGLKEKLKQKINKLKNYVSSFRNVSQQ